MVYPEGIEYVKIHTARADGHHFLLGSSLLKTGDTWICAYGQGLVKENDSASRFACRYSSDEGKTWGDEVVIAGVEGNGFCHSHGVLFEYGRKVWAFTARAKFMGDIYEELTMVAYTRNRNGSWSNRGCVLNAPFWPLCEPMFLENGDILIAGLDCTDVVGNPAGNPAVAISRGGDVMHWEMVTIPNHSNINLWGETSVIDYGDRLVAFMRTNSGTAAVSESVDYGWTWSSLQLSDLEIANSKVYGGTLSTGSKYLIYNYVNRGTMMIAVGPTDGSLGFSTAYLIRNGFKTEPRFLNNRQWAYPYAVEENGKLYVGYAENKENCELAIIPVSSLTVKDMPDTVYATYEESVNADSITLPEHRELLELVDGETKWWTGDGTKGTSNLKYTFIDGKNVVMRLESDDAASKGSHVLRRDFSLDTEGVDLDRLAFVITFWSARDLPASPDNKHRLSWQYVVSKSKNWQNFSNDYTTWARLDQYAGDHGIWGTVKEGWNTWFVSFNALGQSIHAENLNTFFMIFGDSDSVEEDGELFAIASVKVIELGHHARETVTPYEGQEATCNADGLGFIDCENCGAVIVENIRIPAGHTGYELVTQVAPTLATEGSGYIKCTGCEEILAEDIVVPKTGDTVCDPGYEKQVYSKNAALPGNRIVRDLVDGDAEWWTGDGASGTSNLRYTSIDGTDVVMRLESDDAASKGSHVLRRNFTLDTGSVDLDRLAFVITFWSARDLPASPSNKHRLVWANVTSKSGEWKWFSNDYTFSAAARLDYMASSKNLWSTVKAGWNTWIISFSSLGDVNKIAGMNTFFMIFGDSDGVEEDGELFALASVKVIELEHVAGGIVMPYEGNDATCAANGWGYKKCQFCDSPAEEVILIPATGVHIEGDLISDTPVTDFTNGSGHTVCLECGKVCRENVAIPAIAPALFELTVTRMEIIAAKSGRYSAYIESGLAATETLSGRDDIDIKVLEYGVLYAKSMDELTEYIEYKNTGEDVTDLAVRTYAYAISEMGLSRLYGRFSFRFHNIGANTARAAAAFIRYEVEGEIFENFSAVNVAANFMNGFINGAGPLMEFSDELDD